MFQHFDGRRQHFSIILRLFITQIPQESFKNPSRILQESFKNPSEDLSEDLSEDPSTCARRKSIHKSQESIREGGGMEEEGGAILQGFLEDSWRIL